MISKVDIQRWFTFRALTSDQMYRSAEIRERAMKLCNRIVDDVGGVPEQEMGLRMIRAGVTLVIQAIADEVPRI